MQMAFEDLKEKLWAPSVLMYPDLNVPFIVEKGASDHAFGAFLSQKDERSRSHPVQLASRTLNEAK